MKHVRLVLWVTMLSVVLVGGSAWATILDFTDPNLNSAGTLGAAVYLESGIEPAGSGVLHSFVRVNPGGSQGFEQGYNTDFRPLQYDENTSATFTRDLPVSSVPIKSGAVIGHGADPNLNYFEFILDINETNSADGELLSLRRVVVTLANSPNQTGATATHGLPLGAGPVFPFGTQIYDSGAGNAVWLNFVEDAGSGQGDMFLYVPVSAAGSFVYLYSEFGGFTGPTGANYAGLECAGTPAPVGTSATGSQKANNNLCSDDGFEEWAVRGVTELPPIPEPGTLLLLGSGLLGMAVLAGRRAAANR